MISDFLIFQCENEENGCSGGCLSACGVSQLDSVNPRMVLVVCISVCMYVYQQDTYNNKKKKIDGSLIRPNILISSARIAVPSGL